MADNQKPHTMSAQEAKAAHNKRKRENKKKQKMVGVSGPSTGSYVRKPELDMQARAKRTAVYLANASKVKTPPEYSLENLKQTRPEIHKYITTTPVITVEKHMHQDLIRAIWYLDLDEKHNFNTKFKVPAANFSMTVMGMWSEDATGKPDLEPTLLVPFAIACFEHRFTPDVFIDRKNFIDLWRTSPDDINMFSQGEVKRINKTTADMKKALAQIDGTDKFQAMTCDFNEAMEEEIVGEELTDQGEELAKTFAEDDRAMDLGDRQFTMYMGENSIEKGLSNKSEGYRMAARAKWFDRIMGLMRTELNALELEKKPDERTLLQFYTKMRRIVELQHLRSVATHDFGFTQFG